MKKTFVNSICLLLFAAGAWQCTPSEYNLVDYKEIDYIGEKIREDKHVHYYYIDGNLNAKTDVRWNMWNSSPDSTYTKYDVRRYDDKIDTVETSWNYMQDTLYYTTKTIKTYSLDGVIRKTVNYSLSDSGWVEAGFTDYNASGQITEIVGNGMYHYWYSYDSLGVYSGKRYEFTGTDRTTLFMDTVIYSNDRLSAIYKEKQWNERDSIWKTRSKILYKLDKHGRIVQKAFVDPDETDSISHSNAIFSYRYNRKGKLKSETTSRRFRGETDFRLEDKTEHHYRRGLKTWELEYHYDDDRWQLDRIYRYKNDFRHKLPLERTLRHGHYVGSHNKLLLFIAIMTEKVDQRLVWTYEKAK